MLHIVLNWFAIWLRSKILWSTTKAKYVNIWRFWQTTIGFENLLEAGWSVFFFFQGKWPKKNFVRVLSLLWASTLLCCVSQPTVVYMLFKWWIMHRLLYETLPFPVGIRLLKLFPKANTHPRTLPPQAPIHTLFVLSQQWGHPSRSSFGLTAPSTTSTTPQFHGLYTAVWQICDE